MSPPRRAQRKREPATASARICKCYDGKDKTFPRKTILEEDDTGKELSMKTRQEFVFESNGERIDARTSVERYNLKVVLLDIAANPRFQQNCKQCGVQVPTSKLVYEFPSRASRGRKSSLKSGIDSDNAGVEDKTLQRRRSGRRVTTEKKAADANGTDSNIHHCNLCDKSYTTRKARNMHQLEHAKDESKLNPKRGSGRRRGRVLIRKTKTNPQRSHLRIDPELPGSSQWSINDKHVTIQLPDIRKRLGVVVGEDGKRRLILRD